MNIKQIFPPLTPIISSFHRYLSQKSRDPLLRIEIHFYCYLG